MMANVAQPARYPEARKRNIPLHASDLTLGAEQESVTVCRDT